MVHKLTILLVIAAFAIIKSDFSDLCQGGGDLEILPHPDKCTHFIICIFGYPQVEECPHEASFYRIWNGTTCVEGDPIYCTEGPVTTTTVPTTTTTTQIPEVPNPPIEGGVCEGVIFGLRAHQDYCWKYVWCMFGFGFVYECSENQIFSARTNFCLRGNRDTCRFWRSGDIEFDAEN